MQNDRAITETLFDCGIEMLKVLQALPNATQNTSVAGKRKFIKYAEDYLKNLKEQASVGLQIIEGLKEGKRVEVASRKWTSQEALEELNNIKKDFSNCIDAMIEDYGSGPIALTEEETERANSYLEDVQMWFEKGQTYLKKIESAA